VRLRLGPTDSEFYDLFAKAAANLVAGADLLRELLGTGSGVDITAAERLREVEHAGDEMTHRILTKLNTTFVTPFDREDIHELASSIDTVLDHMEEAADLVVLYRIKELPPDTALLVEVLCTAAKLTAEAMPGLRSPQRLESYWVRINELENDADTIYRLLVARLFSGGYDALEVLRLKGPLEQLEAAADAFEHLADTVQSIAVKEG
jgi:predicted phosphate transport protein (TIGR00153 family)